LRENNLKELTKGRRETFPPAFCARIEEKLLFELLVLILQKRDFCTKLSRRIHSFFVESYFLSL